MNDDDLSALIRSQATRHLASERLRAAVHTQIALQAAAQAEAPDPRGARPAHWLARWQPFATGWRGAVAGFAAGVALTLGLGAVVPALLHPDGLPEQLVADHVRALRVGPLIAVASSDRHTVKPWFQGRLDYAPPVVDLAAEDFALVGGRVEPVDGAPTAALVYTHHGHVLEVFVWPSERVLAPQRTQRRGFNLQHWSDGAMQAWVVSDMDVAELERFGAAWRAAAAALPAGSDPRAAR